MAVSSPEPSHIQVHRKLNSNILSKGDDHPTYLHICPSNNQRTMAGVHFDPILDHSTIADIQLRRSDPLVSPPSPSSLLQTPPTFTLESSCWDSAVVGTRSVVSHDTATCCRWQTTDELNPYVVCIELLCMSASSSFPPLSHRLMTNYTGPPSLIHLLPSQSGYRTRVSSICASSMCIPTPSGFGILHTRLEEILEQKQYSE